MTSAFVPTADAICTSCSCAVVSSASGGRRRPSHADSGQELDRAGPHLGAVDEHAQPSRIQAHRKVFGDGQVGTEGQFLMDHSHAGLQRVGRRVEVALDAGDEDAAASGRWMPASTFPSVLLPAPFSPIRQ
jgi:hypothetical protein